MTIGEVIDALEKAPPDMAVYYDFCNTRPTTVDSWRGVYAEAALGWTREGDAPKAADLAKHLKAALGITFSGYKGGDFVYRRSTPLHVDNWGEASETGIARVEVGPYCVTIHTEAEPWD